MKKVKNGTRCVPYKLWRLERNKALMNLDIDWAKKNIPEITDNFTLLVAMHKARYHCRDIPNELRHESANFLRQHEFNGVKQSLLPEGQLPK